jgi:hypothetical protein
MNPFKSIDRSPGLAKLIANLSSLMAKQRGLPVVIGIALVIVSLVVQLLNVVVHSPVLEAIGIIVQHVGILAGLIGLLLAEPLGR